MKKIMFIGCGGSGGKTLRYLMDQASADLAARGAGSQLPLTWQFLHIDAPTQEEDRGRGGFKTVTEYNEGARIVADYCSIGSSQNFENVASSLIYKLNEAGQKEPSQLGMAADLASWLPDNSSDTRNLNSTSLTDGAGEYRMIGRALFLNSLDKVIRKIRDSWGRLYSQDAQDDAARVERAVPELATDPFNEEAEKVMVFVVGSMAGGSGASMLLDVARAVHAAADSCQVVLYGFTPEIFTNLPIGVTPGHNANSLAMASEIAALLSAPDSAGNEIDVRLYKALGSDKAAIKETPFQRFFPIGLSQGTSGTVAHQDAKPDTIYRRLGRGLGRLVMSSAAFDNFIRYTLGNNAGGSSGAVETRKSWINWGANSAASAWSSFGYASLSMGRDRFREYAAQRLARVCADRLAAGHIDRTSLESVSTQLKNRVEANLNHFADSLGIPGVANLPVGTDTSSIVGGWVADNFGSIMNQLGMEMSQIQANFPSYPLGDDSLTSMNAWMANLQAGIPNRQNALKPVKDSLEVRVRDFLRDNLGSQSERILNATREAIAAAGLEYASNLLEQIRLNYLPAMQAALERLSQTPVALENIGQRTVAFLQQNYGQARKTKEEAGLSQRVNDAFGKELFDTVNLYVMTRISAMLTAAYADMGTNFFQPLIAQLNNDLKELNLKRSQTSESVGVEMFATDVYAHWPTEEAVPARFEVAHNEVVITEVASFPHDYERLLMADTDTAAKSAQSSESQIAVAVITGKWKTVAGVESPQNLLQSTQKWLAQNLRRIEQGEEPSTGRFKLNVTPAEIVKRSRLYLDRSQQPFDKYIRQDFKEYGTDSTLGAADLAQRQELIAKKFLQAMNMAKPMVSVDRNIAISLHVGVNDIVRSFNFSPIPFAAQDSGIRIYDAMQNESNLSASTKSEFQTQMTQNRAPDGIRRVDIFGTYQNYAPITYSSMFKPIYEYWSNNNANREHMTKGRRVRSLRGFIPTSDADRKAMIGGWLLGRILNLVSLPANIGENEPPAVFDPEVQTMVPFPWPLYSPPQYFKRDFQRDDWLPAVLESMCLGMLGWYRLTGKVVSDERDNPLRCYRLLREIYNDQDSPDSNVQLAAERHLVHFLNTGAGPNGPALLGTEDTTPEARAASLEAYLQGVIQDYTMFFLTPGQEFQDINRMDRVYDVPKIADLAIDVVEVCQELIAASQRALLQTGESSSGISARRNTTIL